MTVPKAQTRVVPLQEAYGDALAAVALEKVVGVLGFEQTSPKTSPYQVTIVRGCKSNNNPSSHIKSDTVCSIGNNAVEGRMPRT